MHLDLYRNFHSVAIFGSNARNDSDNLSDRDLLLVTDLHKTADEFNTLKSNGFSPSAYTWKALEKLSKNGALFLIHLQRESIILKDNEHRLQRLLDATAPAKDYKKTMQESIYLAELTFNIPDEKNVRLWAADVLAVAFRNFMIAYAATKGDFIFSYGALIEYSVRNLYVKPDLEECLYKLRQWKSFYRNSYGLSDHNVPSQMEINLVQSFFKLISSDNKNVVKASYCKSSFVKELLMFSELKRPWYHKLRLFEGIYRAIDQSFFEENEIFEVEKIISSPSFYDMNGQVSWKIVKAIVEKNILKTLG